MDKKKPAAKSKAAGKKNSVKTRKRSTGWARTKEYPHKRHPAYYRYDRRRWSPLQIYGI